MGRNRFYPNPQKKIETPAFMPRRKRDGGSCRSAFFRIGGVELFGATFEPRRAVSAISDTGPNLRPTRFGLAAEPWFQPFAARRAVPCTTWLAA